MNADFIGLDEPQLIALLQNPEPALRCWAFKRLAAIHGIHQLDPAWINAMLLDEEPSCAEQVLVLIDDYPDLIARHMPQLSKHAAGLMLTKLRALTGDMDALGALLDHQLTRPGPLPAALLNCAAPLLKLDPERYLATRLAPGRPPLDAHELTSWLLHAPQHRPDQLATLLLGCDADSFGECLFGIEDALGMRAVGYIELEDDLSAQLDEVRAQLQEALQAALPAAPPNDLGPTPPLAAHIAQLPFEALPQHLVLLNLAALCIERELLLHRLDPHTAPPAQLIAAWLYTGPHHDETLRAWTLERWSQDPDAREPLLDAILLAAPTLYNANRHAPLYLTLLDAPGFDPAHILSWDLPDWGESRTDEICSLDALLCPLVQRDPARWLQSLPHVTRVHIASGMTAVRLLTALPGSWSAPARIAWFEAAYGAIDPLYNNELYEPISYEHCRDELMVELLHLPTLRHHAARINKPDGFMFVDLAPVLLYADQRGLIPTDVRPALHKQLGFTRRFAAELLRGDSLDPAELLRNTTLAGIDEELAAHPGRAPLLLERTRLLYRYERHDQAREELARALSLLPDPSVVDERPTHASWLAQALRHYAEPDHMLRLWLPAPQHTHDAIMLSDLQRWDRLASLLAMPGVKNIRLERADTPPPKQILYKFLTEDDAPPEPVRAGPKVGRNEPCPCGSGKKYKKCHGAGGD